MALLDRLKARLLELAAGAIATADYYHTARAKLLKQSANLRRVDVGLDDKALPSMTNIPLKMGVPGIEVTLPGGGSIIVAWEDGRPDRPYATLWDPGKAGAVPLKATWHAQFIELGGGPALPNEGVLNGQAIDPFTGLPHFMLGNSSVKVFAKKV